MANPGYLMRSPSNHMFKQLFLQLGTCRYRNLCIAKQCTPAQQYKGSFSIPIFSTRYKSSDVAKDTGGTIWQPTLYGHPSTKTAIFFPGPVKCSSCFWENTVDGSEIRRENQFFDMGEYPPVFIGFYISKNWFSRRISELLDQCMGQFLCFGVSLISQQLIKIPQSIKSFHPKKNNTWHVLEPNLFFKLVIF